MTDGFQPGGRSPAPAPLDLVQDFVNTEIPDWDRDDIATPEALGAWLAGPRASRARRDGRLACGREGARAPCRAPRPRAREHARRAARALARARHRRDARAIPARGAARRGGAGARTRGRRCAGRARDGRGRRRRGAASRRLGADEGLPPGDLRLALLRRLAQPLVELVLDADLRRPREGARLPQARCGEAGVVPLPAMPSGSLARDERRHASSSVVPIPMGIGTPCVLAWLAPRTPETRPHHWKGH